MSKLLAIKHLLRFRRVQEQSFFGALINSYIYSCRCFQDIRRYQSYYSCLVNYSTIDFRFRDPSIYCDIVRKTTGIAFGNKTRINSPKMLATKHLLRFRRVQEQSFSGVFINSQMFSCRCFQHIRRFHSHYSFLINYSTIYFRFRGPSNDLNIAWTTSGIAFSNKTASLFFNNDSDIRNISKLNTTFCLDLRHISYKSTMIGTDILDIFRNNIYSQDCKRLLEYSIKILILIIILKTLETLSFLVLTSQQGNNFLLKFMFG